MVCPGRAQRILAPMLRGIAGRPCIAGRSGIGGCCLLVCAMWPGLELALAWWSDLRAGIGTVLRRHAEEATVVDTDALESTHAPVWERTTGRLWIAMATSDCSTLERSSRELAR